MNEKNKNEKLISYQTLRLRSLISEIIHCCQERMVFETRKFNLPRAGLNTLMLFGQERYLTVKGISQVLDVAKSRVTIIVDGLVKKELVNRITDAHDNRIKLIHLTPNGQKKLEEIEAFIYQIHQKLLIQLNSDQRTRVISSLELLRSSMEAVKAQLK